MGQSIPSYVNRLAKIGKFFFEIDDFFRMTPVDKKYEVCPIELGVTKKSNRNVFDGGSGVKIG